MTLIRYGFSAALAITVGCSFGTANASALAWDAAFEGAKPESNQYLIEEGGNKASSVPGRWGYARTVQSFTTGDKIYAEVRYESGYDQAILSVVTDEADVGRYGGADADGWGYYTAGYFYNNSQKVDPVPRYVAPTERTTAGMGRVIQIALDLTGSTGLLWFGVDGEWFGGGDPTQGLAGNPVFSDLDVNDTFYLAWGDGERASGVEVGTFISSMDYEVPDDSYDGANDGLDRDEENDGSGDNGGSASGGAASIPAPAGALLLAPALLALTRRR